MLIATSCELRAASGYIMFLARSSWLVTRSYFDFPGDICVRLPERGRHRAVFVHGKGAGLLRFLRIDISLQLKNDMDICPEGRFLAFFPLAIARHTEAIYPLPLLFQNGHDVDAATACQAYQQH